MPMINIYSNYIAQVGLEEFPELFSQPPHFMDYSCVTPCLAQTKFLQYIASENSHLRLL